LETFYFNHNLDCESYFCDDIRKLVDGDLLEESSYKNLDLVVGGPPCQGFSMANRQRILEKYHRNKEERLKYQIEYNLHHKDELKERNFEREIRRTILTYLDIRTSGYNPGTGFPPYEIHGITIDVILIK
jgi:site-specific DNA-cytosine methylase